MADDVFDLTQKARRLGLAGDFNGGHALVDQALPLAGDDPAGLAMCAIERGRLYNSTGRPDDALPSFHQAWRHARDAQAHDLAVDAAHMIAVAGKLDDAVEWTGLALAYIAEHPEAERWRGPLLNNLGWSFFDAGCFEEALPIFERAVDVRRSRSQPRELRIASYAVVRTLRALGRTGAALRLGEQIVNSADMDGEQVPYVYEELAECYTDAGSMDQARSYAERALAILERDESFARQQPQRLTRLRELSG